MEVARQPWGWNLGLVLPALPRRSRLSGSAEAEACRKSTSTLHTPRLCNLSARSFLRSHLFSVKLEVHFTSSSTPCLCNAQPHRICQVCPRPSRLVYDFRATAIPQLRHMSDLLRHIYQTNRVCPLLLAIAAEARNHSDPMRFQQSVGTHRLGVAILSVCSRRISSWYDYCYPSSRRSVSK